MAEHRNTDMENRDDLTLSAFLEQDRDMVMAQLEKDRDPDRAVRLLEKETDRLMYRAGALDGRQAAMAQGMLQVLKNTLPLVGSVTEAEVWEKDGTDSSSSGRFLTVPSIVCLIAGAACVLAGILAPVIAGPVLAAAGGALLWISGLLAGGGLKGKKKKDTKRNIQKAFLIEPARVYHTLQGTLLAADHSLESAAEDERVSDGAGGDARDRMEKRDMSFFADLLENAYARRRQAPSDAAMDEQVENIRYYLHEHGIETQDYTPQAAGWFEMLPSDSETVTIRPAMLRDNAVVVKGIASGHLS